MKVMPAGKAKNAFGLLLDTARAEPVTIEKHGRPVAVVLSAEAYERLVQHFDDGANGPGPRAIEERRDVNSAPERNSYTVKTT